MAAKRLQGKSVGMLLLTLEKSVGAVFLLITTVVLFVLRARGVTHPLQSLFAATAKCRARLLAALARCPKIVAATAQLRKEAGTSADSAAALVVAIRSGDVLSIEQLLAENPGLASSTLGGDQGRRTPLHIVTDWPGYFPNGPEIVRMLIEAGADPNARNPGKRFAETPLHWAASSDVDVASALIDGGADLEAPNGSIGTPLGNAVGYACWHVARLLVSRGAKVEALWHAAALGMMPRLEELVNQRPAPKPEELSQAFWHACAGGQRRAAEYLLNGGADLNWIPDYAKGTPLDAASGLGTRQETLITWLRAQGARSSEQAG